MGFTIVVTGNHVEGFTAAELSWTTASGEHQLGRVFERPSGWVFQLFAEDSPRDMPFDDFVDHLRKAREALLPYVNRVGLDPPEALTSAAMSLWLMTKADGTAMGSRVEW